MNFINTWALIGLIGVPILILIYLIRHRYREEVVSSTFLWKRSLKYMKRRIPFNLKNIILLLLQICAVTLVVLVVARPTVSSEKTGEVIAIIDASSSMMTTDENGTTRLDRAKAEIARLAEEADEHNPVTVICAGESAKKVLHRSGERLAIVNALDNIGCDWGSADTVGALDIAREIRRENVGARVLFYTDTIYESMENIETVLMTSGEWNAAVHTLEVRQLNNGAFSFIGEVASYGRDEELNVVLYVDGEYVQAKKVQCEDGEITEVAFREYEAVDYMHAEIRLDLSEGTDALPHDNNFSVYQKVNTTNRVELIFAPNTYDEFLIIALRAAKIGYQVVNISSLDERGCENRANATGGYNEPKIKYEGYGAYIFVGVVPEWMPSDGTTWLLNPPNIMGELNLGVELGDKITDLDKRGYDLLPLISSDEEEFSILSGMTFVDPNATQLYDNAVKVLTYRPLTVLTRTEGNNEVAETEYVYKAIMGCETENGTQNVFLVGKNSSTHARIILSSMESSSLTASLEYTLLIANLIDYACPTIIEEGNRVVGDEATLTLPVGTIGVEVIKDGTTISMTGRREYNKTSDTIPQDCVISFDEPGDYTVRLHISYVDQYGELSDTKQTDYSSYVSLASTESNIYQDLPELTAIIPEDGVQVIVPVEIWIYLLIALLVILMAEWWVYHHA